MGANGYDYVGNLLDMVDLTKKAEPKKETEAAEKAVKTPAQPAKHQDKAPSKARSSYKPKKPARAPWADRIPNADEDYIIPDEALYPDKDDDEESFDK